MKNKLLFLVLIILLPFSFINKKEEKSLPKEIVVNLKTNEEDLSLSLNDYLIGVVGAEMPASFNMEALKAQAIAARTFALNYLNNNEIEITLEKQMYLTLDELKNKFKNDYDKYINIIKESVYSTNNLVIKYDNKLIKSYYFSMSNGKTESSKTVFNEELPYLESVDSSFELDLKNIKKETIFSYENFCALLSINPCDVNINEIIKDSTNRVDKIVINNKEYTGIYFRKLLSLKSTDFDIKLNDQIIITTKGYGHGVGMSQYGANELAKIGYSYQDIIKYYYKGVEIENY